MISGRYVERFSEASHALPDGMHMNADYPFMIPKIIAYDGRTVTIQSNRIGGEIATFIARRRRGRGMYGWLAQSSTFERLFNRPPQKFKMLPFKDEHTPSIAEQQTRAESAEKETPRG